MPAQTESLRTNAYLSLLERRIEVLRLLSLEMAAAREAFVSLDLERIQQFTLTQENLCTEVQFLDAEITALTQLESFLNSDNPERIDQLKKENVEAAAQVARHNRVLGALLRRSRRSVNALMNSLAQANGSYAANRGSRTRSVWASRTQGGNPGIGSDATRAKGSA